MMARYPFIPIINCKLTHIRLIINVVVTSLQYWGEAITALFIKEKTLPIIKYEMFNEKFVPWMSEPDLVPHSVFRDVILDNTKQFLDRAITLHLAHLLASMLSVSSHVFWARGVWPICPGACKNGFSVAPAIFEEFLTSERRKAKIWKGIRFII